MSKEQDLEKQLVELRKAKDFVLDKLDDCMRHPEKIKASMWDAVTPIIKGVIENKIKGTAYDRREVAEIIFAKAVKCVLGEDAFTHLEKL